MKYPTAVIPRQELCQPAARARAEAARVLLGLSEKEQVSRPRSPLRDQVARCQRLRRVIRGAGQEMSLAHQRKGLRYRCAMVTLTYHPDKQWEAHHVSQYIRRVRQWMHRRGHQLRYVWVAELQRRGAVHYHVLIWMPRGLTLPKPDKQGHWPHGSTRIEWARRPVGYLIKYASKLTQQAGKIPKGLRIFGIGGCPIHLGWWRAPAWMRQIASPRMRVVRRYGCWWCVDDLAHAYRSPWRLLHVSDTEIQVEWVGWQPQDIMPLALLERDARLQRPQSGSGPRQRPSGTQ